jgi:hypothetical protein
MGSAFCISRDPARWVAKPVIAMCALASVLLVAPTAAGACANVTKVKSFHAFVFSQLVQTASGSDSIGGKLSVSLNQSTGTIHFPSLTPLHGTQHRGFGGKPKAGGVVNVEDHYTDDDSPGPVTTGTQTADGPPHSARASIAFSHCKYDVLFGFDIATTSSGQWPNPPDRGVSVLAVSPPQPIPANLKGSGSATIRWYRGESPLTGYYRSYGLLPGGSQWENEFSDILSANSQPDATASITWGFAPNK